VVIANKAFFAQHIYEKKINDPFFHAKYRPFSMDFCLFTDLKLPSQKLFILKQNK